MTTRVNPGFDSMEDEGGYTVASDVTSTMAATGTAQLNLHSKSDNVYVNDEDQGKGDHCLHKNDKLGKGEARCPKDPGEISADNSPKENKRCDVTRRVTVVGVMVGLVVALVVAVMAVSMVTSVRADMADLKSKLLNQEIIVQVLSLENRNLTDELRSLKTEQQSQNPEKSVQNLQQRISAMQAKIEEQNSIIVDQNIAVTSLNNSLLSQMEQCKHDVVNLESKSKTRDRQLMLSMNESSHIETGHANCYDSSTWTQGPEMRYIEVPVRFKQPYPRPPSVHLAMGYLSGLTNKNIYYSLATSGVDTTGFKLLCYRVLSYSYIRQIRVHWVSFPATD